MLGLVLAFGAWHAARGRRRRRIATLLLLFELALAGSGLVLLLLLDLTPAHLCLLLAGSGLVLLLLELTLSHVCLVLAGSGLALLLLLELMLAHRGLALARVRRCRSRLLRRRDSPRGLHRRRLPVRRAGLPPPFLLRTVLRGQSLLVVEALAGVDEVPPLFVVCALLVLELTLAIVEPLAVGVAACSTLELAALRIDLAAIVAKSPLLALPALLLDGLALPLGLLLPATLLAKARVLPGVGLEAARQVGR